MSILENSRQRKLHEIISIIKLSSLLFSGIIIFIHISSTYAGELKDFQYTTPIWGGSILLLIYMIWHRFSEKSNDVSYGRKACWIEDFSFILIFSVLIIISGGYISQYKFLFLFIIITSTIESGIKQGVVMSIISSIIVLGIDLYAMSDVVVNSYFENDLILGGVFILTAWPLGYYVKVEGEYGESLSKLVNIDGLTEVYNHRYFHESLKKQIELSNLSRQAFSVMLIDIDHFHYYNEINGDHYGDQVLKEIALLLRKNVEPHYTLSRYRRDEFSVIIPDVEEVNKLSERIRIQLRGLSFKGEENQPEGKITVSIGKAVFPEDGENNIKLMENAHDSLKKVKLLNKNRVENFYYILEGLKQDMLGNKLDLITSFKTIISFINSKDRYTYGHTERVVMYSKLLGERLRLSEKEMEVLQYGAYLHDIGKINISTGILIKKTPLTNEEWEILKYHPSSGVEIIKNAEVFNDVLPVILHHHERYDGGGYPSGLRGEGIPYLSRILCVADSFDAMTSDRPYNTRMNYNDAIVELKSCMGVQFDPAITMAFIEVIRENFDGLNIA